MAETKGWVRIDRQIQNHWLWEDEPFSMGQAWIDLILLANHEDGKFVCNGSVKRIKRGQKWTSVRKLSNRWQWGHTKVEHFLDALEEDGMIIKEPSTSGTLLTIVNYGKFQDYRYTDEHTDEHTNGTRTEHLRYTDEQQTTNINNDNNDNNEKEKEIVLSVIKYLNEKTGSQYNPADKWITQNIVSRIREGHNAEEFKQVVDVKFAEWTGTKMEVQLKPSVLFGKKFGEYLNQKVKERRSDEYAGQRTGYGEW